MPFNRNPLRLLEPEERRPIIVKAFEECGCSMQDTAERLKITTTTLYRWVKQDEELRLGMRERLKRWATSEFDLDHAPTTQEVEKSAQHDTVAELNVKPRAVPERLAGVAARGTYRARSDNWE